MLWRRKQGRNRTWITFWLLTLLLSAAALPAPATGAAPATGGATAAGAVTPEELLPRLQEIYAYRAALLITSDEPAKLAALYLAGSRTAEWALEHEQNKVRYMQTWAKNRGVRIVESNPTVKISWFRPGKDLVQLGVTQTLQLGYSYPDEESVGIVNRFGIGTRHWLELTKQDGLWIIRREWYTDPLGDDTLIYRPTPAAGLALPEGVDPNPPLPPDPAEGKRYNRLAAAAYADKYAGAAWGAGNDGKYNPRYRDYNGIGGDCTNFASQALGDKKEGGGLPMDGSWYYRGSGSTAWVQTDTFARWLRYSGKARLVARGKYAEVAQPNEKFARGAVRELQLGDVIAFDEKNDVQHFSVITAFDSKGYPLVNAHTADRYHSPWDLGWDKSATFWLFHLID
ncbi:MAG: amidase domain-containing protein [Symbiobacteriia bacterium]